MSLNVVFVSFPRTSPPKFVTQYMYMDRGQCLEHRCQENRENCPNSAQSVEHHAERPSSARTAANRENRSACPVKLVAGHRAQLMYISWFTFHFSRGHSCCAPTAKKKITEKSEQKPLAHRVPRVDVCDFAFRAFQISCFSARLSSGESVFSTCSDHGLPCRLSRYFLV